MLQNNRNVKYYLTVFTQAVRLFLNQLICNVNLCIYLHSTKNKYLVHFTILFIVCSRQHVNYYCCQLNAFYDKNLIMLLFVKCFYCQINKILHLLFVYKSLVLTRFMVINIYKIYIHISYKLYTKQ